MGRSKELGAKLALLMKARGLTQSGIADKIGMPISQMNRFLNGRSDMTSENLLTILNELDIDINEIVSSKLKRHSAPEAAEMESIGDCLHYLYGRLDEIGRQTYLGSLAWTAKTASRKRLPQSVERILEKELNLI